MARQDTGVSILLKADRHYTYRDYRSWPEDERWELFHGTAFAMSPAPQRIHQGMVVRLLVQLSAYFEGKPCKPYMAPVDVFFPDGDETLDDIDLVLQPDLMVVCDPDKLIDEGIRGAPDLIIEVLSPGTAMRDQTDKRDIYEKYGVREYWVTPIPSKSWFTLSRMRPTVFLFPPA
jgi:Uma2 family endonuclease